MSRYTATDSSASTGTGGFMVGLMCGAAIGTAIGLLFAPKAGEELRGQIADSAGRVRRRANDTYTRASAAVSDLAGKGRDAVSDFADKGREAIRRGKETYQDTQANFNREMSSEGQSMTE